MILLAAPFLVLIPLWDKFPRRVAIHWGLDGQPNGWADKEWGLLLLPVTNIALAGLFALLPWIDIRRRNYSAESQASLRRVLKIFNLSAVALMAGMALLIDAIALGWKVDVLKVVTLGTLIVFGVLGNYMPKLRPNRYIGIRTPWTLKSPEVWYRTHRVFGPVMLVGSFLMLPLCLLAPSVWSVWLMLGFILLLTFGATAFSYACYKSLPLSGTEEGDGKEEKRDGQD